MTDKQSAMVKKLKGYAAQHPEFKEKIPVLCKKVAQLQKKQAQLKFKEAVAVKVKKAGLTPAQNKQLQVKIAEWLEKRGQGLNLNNPYAQPPTQAANAKDIFTQWAVQKRMGELDKLPPQQGAALINQEVNNMLEQWNSTGDPTAKRMQLRRVAAAVNANKPVVQQYTTLKGQDPELASRFMSFYNDATTNQGLDPAKALQSWSQNEHAEKYRLLAAKDPALAKEFQSFLTKAKAQGLDRNTAWKQWRGVENQRLQEHQEYRNIYKDLNSKDPLLSGDFNRFMRNAAANGMSRSEAFANWERAQSHGAAERTVNTALDPKLNRERTAPGSRFGAVGTADDYKLLNSDMPIPQSFEGAPFAAGNSPFTPAPPNNGLSAPDLTTTNQSEILRGQQRLQGAPALTPDRMSMIDAANAEINRKRILQTGPNARDALNPFLTPGMPNIPNMSGMPAATDVATSMQQPTPELIENVDHSLDEMRPRDYDKLTSGYIDPPAPPAQRPRMLTRSEQQEGNVSAWDMMPTINPYTYYWNWVSGHPAAPSADQRLKDMQRRPAALSDRTDHNAPPQQNLLDVADGHELTQYLNASRRPEAQPGLGRDAPRPQPPIPDVY